MLHLFCLRQFFMGEFKLPDPGRAMECEKGVVPQPVHCRSHRGISVVFRNAATWHVQCGDQIATLPELDI